MTNVSNQELKKIEAEADKLSAEADYFREDTSFIGVRIFLQCIATGAALFGVIIGAAKALGA